MSYIFNYIDFYNYYINPSNVITDTNDCVRLYYFTDSDKIKKVRKSNPKCTYIIVNGIKIYITNDNKKNVYTNDNDEEITENTYGLHFSIPTMINPKHFSFWFTHPIKLFQKSNLQRKLKILSNQWLKTLCT